MNLREYKGKPQENLTLFFLTEELEASESRDSPSFAVKYNLNII